MSDGFYESDAQLSEYLLLHYGSAEDILPYPFGPSDALDFPIRCVSSCLDLSLLSAGARALDLGCAVGRASFELARHCGEVIGIDASSTFIAAAKRLQAGEEIRFETKVEGDRTRPSTARVPPDLPRARVKFETGDACHLRPGLGSFHVVLLANLIDRLPSPRRCLRHLAERVEAGGQVVITSPYTWMETFTPREEWLGRPGGAGGDQSSLEALKELLVPDFDLVRRQDLPFLIREHARKYQWSVAEATTWRRR